MVSAVGEVQLSEVDQEASDKANPECNPQRFSPQVARNECWEQNVENSEKNFVVAAWEENKNKSLKSKSGPVWD